MDMVEVIVKQHHQIFESETQLFRPRPTETSTFRRDAYYPPSGRGQGHVTHYRILPPPEISLQRLQVETSNFVHELAA